MVLLHKSKFYDSVQNCGSDKYMFAQLSASVSLSSQQPDYY